MRELTRIDGVHDVERVRVRRAGNEHFVDLTLGLARNLTFQRSEQIVMSATDAVKRLLPDADVVVHTVPRRHLHREHLRPHPRRGHARQRRHS